MDTNQNSITFKDFNFLPELQKSLDDMGFSDPTPIQQNAIPLVLDKKDIAGLAQTGTGKTAAFLLPLIQRILQSIEGTNPDQAFENWGKKNYCLILVPTRELAEQVDDNIKKFSCGKISSAVIIGGKEYDEQIKAIASGVDFIVATPGRLIDLYKDKKVDLSFVKACVFDEADRMFDMGFKEDMVYLLKRIPSDRQLLMFSATMNFDVLNVAYEFGSEPIEINIDKDQATAENVEDAIFHVGQDEKPQFLYSVFLKYNPDQAIIFSNFKRNIPNIEKFLRDNGIKCLGISSSLNQNQRQKVMQQFKDGEVKALVATDVAARGLDIKGVDLVINFELPDDAENYVHRIGRTGRAGAKGKAFSFVSEKDVAALQRIEDYVGDKIEIGWMDSEDLAKDFKAYDYRYDSKDKFGKLRDKTRDQSYKKYDKDKDRPRRTFERKPRPTDANYVPPESKKSEDSHSGARVQKNNKFKKTNSKNFKAKDKKSASSQKSSRYEGFKSRKRSVAVPQKSSGVLGKIKKLLGF